MCMGDSANQIRFSVVTLWETDLVTIELSRGLFFFDHGYREHSMDQTRYSPTFCKTVSITIYLNQEVYLSGHVYEEQKWIR